MPITDRKLRVFLCHDSQDKPIVRELYQKLLIEGWIDPWLDEEKLLPGQDWDMEIEKAIEETDAVVVCLSNNSVTKEGYVQHELRLLLNMADYKPEGTLFIIPIRLDECPLPRRLKMWHIVDSFPESRHEWAYGRLTASLKIRADEICQRETNKQTTIEKHRINVEEHTRLELEERIRKETETRIRAEYEAREKAQPVTEIKEQKRQPVINIVEPSDPDEKVGRIGNSPNPDRLTLNGIVFCRIPAGKFLMGSADNDNLAYDDEKPQHTVEIPYDYWLARFPVTNAQYAEYVQAANKKHPVVDWQKKTELPTTRVSWKDALAYCQWLKGLLQGQLPPSYFLRLPTVAEWEKAARGVDGRIYPWGNIFDKNKCNALGSGISGITPVGKYSPQGDSSYGCADLCGNVWEWTHSLFKPYPYQVGDGREKETTKGNRAIHGSSCGTDSRYARCAYGGDYPISGFSDYGGFRVAVAPALP